MQVADHIWQRLLDGDVRRICGYPGDSISGLMGALDRLGTLRATVKQMFGVGSQ
jgi:thiamine pyrophosphate-dependent acetolactate synthase large subunit-like protein